MHISQLQKEISNQLKEVGIENYILDTEILICHALDIERHKLVIDPDRILTTDEINNIKKLCDRRMKFEPIAYILGQKEFYSIDFHVNQDVLIPRPETELLVDLAIYYAPQNGTVLDLGTGSGAIAIALKHNRKDLQLFASDISEKALNVAKKNCSSILGKEQINFFQGNLFEPFNENKFNVIVSNPPYIDKQLSSTLQKELQYEPQGALYSNDNGTEILQLIISQASGFLQEGGILILEIGYDLKNFILETGKSNGFSSSVLNDYSGLPRVAVLKK